MKISDIIWREELYRLTRAALLYKYIGVGNTEQRFSANIRQNQNSTKTIEHPKIVNKRNIIYQKDIWAMARVIFTPWKTQDQLLAVRDQFYPPSAYDGPDLRSKACAKVCMRTVREAMIHANKKNQGIMLEVTRESASPCGSHGTLNRCDFTRRS